MSILLALALLGPQAASPAQLEAFEAARARLPERLRARVEDVRLVRRPDLGVPAEAPLAARLFGRGALAYLDTSERVVVLTDAGASGVARWHGPAPSRAEVANFLDSIAPALRGLDPRAEDRTLARWIAFRAQVGAWTDSALDGDVGDVRVLDTFLAEAPWRSLGERPPLEALLQHELAHAVQLQLDTMRFRVESWSAVTGWRERHDGSLADGLRAAWLNEEPAALVRLVLGGERGEGAYVPGAGPAPNLYARFDPREDFAEAARLMAWDPRRLARVSPSRFLAMNATGWIADVDLEHPGPLWVGPTELGAELFEATVARGATELWERWQSSPEAEPASFTAVLRAHSQWIPPASIPIVDAESVAADLPPLAEEAAQRARFTVADGAPRSAPQEVLAAFHDDFVVSHLDELAFRDGFLTMLRRGTRDDFDEREREDVLDVTGARRRGEAILELLSTHADVLPVERRRAVVEREARLLEEAELPLVAARLRLLHGVEPLEERLDLAMKSLAGDATYDRVELTFARASVLATAGRREEALAAARAIPGTTWGVRRKVAALLGLNAPHRALEAAHTAALPVLRDRLRLEVAGHFAQADDHDAAHRAALTVEDPKRHARALEHFTGE